MTMKMNVIFYFNTAYAFQRSESKQSASQSRQARFCNYLISSSRADSNKQVEPSFHTLPLFTAQECIQQPFLDF